VNTVLTFLYNNWQRLALDDYGVPRELTTLIITPRFRASSHVVFLLLPEGQAAPVLVAKAPRLSGASATIRREADNLRAVQASRPGGFDSIPRLIAFEEYGGRQMLVETALNGRPMDPVMVHRNFDACCQAVIRWLADIQPAAGPATAMDANWFERLAERPLRYFEAVFPLSTEEEQLLEQTWAVVASLRQVALPLVFEHGDLSHPNLFLFSDGTAGVVDWELAEPHGLPACDLFFFLTYVAFARRKARSTRDYITSFQAAFFGQSAWARPYIETYTRQHRLLPSLLGPLFVLCWARYTANLLLRLNNDESIPEQLRPETVAWLRTNRYYTLWRYAITHMDELLTWSLLPMGNGSN
jgi:aminoglycoside phosphotransferase